VKKDMTESDIQTAMATWLVDLQAPIELFKKVQDKNYALANTALEKCEFSQGDVEVMQRICNRFFRCVPTLHKIIDPDAPTKPIQKIRA
jgi:hypothetical protein